MSEVTQHEHRWIDTDTDCEVCGTHPAIYCDTPEECPVVRAVTNGNQDYIDLAYYDDPRDSKPARRHS